MNDQPIKSLHPDNISKTFCGLAFKQLHVTPSGIVKPCCIFNGPLKDNDQKAVRIGDKPVDDIWNMDHFKAIRLKMLNGEEVVECSQCMEEEKSFSASERIQRGYVNPHVYQRAMEAKNNNGSVESLPDFLDLKMGNTCNLKCRMCQPLDSISIDAEFYQISKSNPKFRHFDNASSHDYYYNEEPLEIATKWIEEKLARENVEKVLEQSGKSSTVVTFALAGGEVTYTPQALNLIDFCIKNGYSKNITFALSTNLTKVTDEFIQKLSEFERSVIICSIDGIGKTLEYIRYPSKWDVVYQNYMKLVNGPSNILPILSPTIQIYNILEVDKILNLITDAAEKKLAAYDISPAKLTMLYYPQHLNLRYLPNEIKKLAYMRLVNFSEKFPILKRHETLNDDVKLLLETLKIELSSEDTKKYLSYFLKYTEVLDRSRSQKIENELPELYSLIKRSEIIGTYPAEGNRSFSFYSFRDNGFSAMAKGDHGKAKRSFNKAFQLCKDDEDLLFNMALNFKLSGEIDNSEIYYKQLFQINPKHYECILELGFLNQLNRNYIAAKEYFFLAMTYEPLDKKGNAEKIYRDNENNF